MVRAAEVHGKVKRHLEVVVLMELERLAGDIKAVEAALEGKSGVADTGERARNTVRRAMRLVAARLEEGGRRGGRSRSMCGGD